LISRFYPNDQRDTASIVPDNPKKSRPKPWEYKSAKKKAQKRKNTHTRILWLEILENPRVGGSNPPPGTIVQKASAEMLGLFLVRDCRFSSMYFDDFMVFLHGSP
jgi:hypothetical protein